MFFLRYTAGIQFVDRGSLGAVDFDVGDLIKDGNYHDLDLSGIIGARRCLVQIQLLVVVTTLNKFVGFRTKGYTDGYNRYVNYIHVINNAVVLEPFIYTDKNGVIEYRLETATWTTANITIRGWFVL